MTGELIRSTAIAQFLNNRRGAVASVRRHDDDDGIPDAADGVRIGRAGSRQLQRPSSSSQHHRQEVSAAARILYRIFGEPILPGEAGDPGPLSANKGDLYEILTNLTRKC